MSSEALTSKRLEALRYALRNFGRRHFPALRDEVDDLTAQTLSDLWEYLGAHDGDDLGDEHSVERIAFSIFKRRAADIFRGSARRWALSLEQLPDSELIDHGGIDDAKSLLYQKMLRICMAELAHVEDEDGLLLTIAAETGRRQEGAMTVRDRQRLHRLRVRLAAAVKRELGEDAKALLREDF